MFNVIFMGQLGLLGYLGYLENSAPLLLCASALKRKGFYKK